MVMRCMNEELIFLAESLNHYQLQRISRPGCPFSFGRCGALSHQQVNDDREEEIDR